MLRCSASLCLGVPGVQRVLGTCSMFHLSSSDLLKTILACTALPHCNAAMFAVVASCTPTKVTGANLGGEWYFTFNSPPCWSKFRNDLFTKLNLGWKCLTLMNAPARGLSIVAQFVYIDQSGRTPHHPMHHWCLHKGFALNTIFEPICNILTWPVAYWATVSARPWVPR